VIGPNGAGKTTLFQHDRGPGAAGLGHAQGRRDGEARRTSIRAASRSNAEKHACTRRSPAAATIITLGKREVNARAYCSWLQLPRRRPAEEGRDAVGR
jgi:ABC-type hemin transport system ATPase subunit